MAPSPPPDPFAEFLRTRALIQSGGDTDEERLRFAYGVIARLLDDRAFLRAVAADQEASVLALESELGAARAKLEMLRETDKASRPAIRSIVAGVLTTICMVSQVSGYTVKDLAAPDNPASPLVVLVEPSDLQQLGIPVPAIHEGAGHMNLSASATGTVDIGVPAADVTVAGVEAGGPIDAAGPIGPGETLEQPGILRMTNRSNERLRVMYSHFSFNESSTLIPGHRSTELGRGDIGIEPGLQIENLTDHQLYVLLFEEEGDNR